MRCGVWVPGGGGGGELPHLLSGSAPDPSDAASLQTRPLVVVLGPSSGSLSASTLRSPQGPGRYGTPGPMRAVYPFHSCTRRSGVRTPMGTKIARVESRIMTVGVVGSHMARARL